MALITLPIELLKKGQYVVGLDKSWDETPFRSHRFRIKDLSVIEELRASGVRMVTVDTERQNNVRGKTNLKVPEKDNALTSLVSPGTNIVSTLNDIHARLVGKYRYIFDELRREATPGKLVSTNELVHMVEMAETIGRKYPDAFLFLAHLQTNDDETFIHSVNTMFLSLYLSHFYNVSRDETVLWALAGLFHDIGKVLVPERILLKKDALTPEEFLLIKSHPTMGENIIRTKTTLPMIVSRVAGEHHLRKNGGYPDARLFEATDVVTRAIMILDSYDSITADRSYRTGVSPAKAIEKLAKEGEGSLDMAMAKRFFDAMGIYPVGTIVELHNNQIGVVVQHIRPSHPSESEYVPFRAESGVKVLPARTEPEVKVVPARYRFLTMMLRNGQGKQYRKPYLRLLSWSPEHKSPVLRTHNHSEFGLDWERLKRWQHVWVKPSR